MNKDSDRSTEYIQIRVTSAFKERLRNEAYQRRTTYTKLLTDAFLAFLESEGSLLDK